MMIQVKKLSAEEKAKYLIPATPASVDGWSVWECAPSTFNWHYEEEEWAFLYQGRVKVREAAGGTTEFKAGDFVVFPSGLSCSWEVIEPVVKVYLFRK